MAAVPDDEPVPEPPPGGDYEALLTDAGRVLDAVDVALVRLADHTYGACEACGAPIAEDRLAADPTARTCERHPEFAGPGA